ncbi:MAG: hypothetical protein Q4E24_04645 [bacterium]|nr:hypothetical protein [bacterium]
MTETENTQNQQKSLLLPALAAVCLLALAAMAYVLFFAGQRGKEKAEFTPPPFEQSAVKGTPEEEPDLSDGDRLGTLGYGHLDAVEYQVSVCGAPVIENDKAILYLTNPEENQVWLKVRILDERGEILGESGLLRPGEYVKAVDLDMEAVKAALKAAASGENFASGGYRETSEAGSVDLGQGVSSTEQRVSVTLRLMAYEPETYHSAGAVSLATALTVSEP